MLIATAAVTSSTFTVPTLVTFIGAILGIFGIAGAAAAVLRSNYLKATIETLKESNAALAERNDILDEQISECITRVASLEVENESLRNFVTGADAINSLAQSIGQHHSEVMDKFTDMTAAITDHLIEDKRRARRAAIKPAPRRTT